MKNNNLPASTLAAAIALVLSSPAFANVSASASTDAAATTEAAAAERKPTELENVEVIGQAVTEPSSPKLTQPLLDTPQTITVVPGKVIQQRAATTLREVLRNVSGISLIAGEGGGAQGDNMRIRGFGAGTDLFLDGMRDPAQYTRDPFNTEAVEVTKGPASAYSGRGSTGGSVNMVSKAPRLRDFASGSVLLGTDQTRRVGLDLNQSIGETSAFRLGVVHHEADVAGRDVVETKRFGVAPTVGFGLGTATRATLGLYHLQEKGIPDYGLPLVHGHLVEGVDSNNWYGFRNLNTEETKTDVGNFRFEHDFNDTTTVRNQLRHSRNDRYSIVTPPRDPRVVEDDVRINPTGRDTEGRYWQNQTDLTLRLRGDGFEQTIVAGVELAREDIDNQALTFPAPGTLGYRIDLTDPDPNLVFTGPRGFGDRTISRGETVAVYVFNTVELGEKWQLSGGLRHDRFDARSDITTPADVTTRASREDRFTSSRLGVVYKPASNGSVYAAFGTSFNPSAEAGVLSSAPTSTSTALLPPEKNRSFEVGTKWDVLDRHLQLNAAWFRTDKTNARTRELSTAPYVLDGEQRVQGIELGAIGKLTDNWDVFAGYTYLDSEVLESSSVDPVTGLPNEEGNRLGGSPKHSASLWTTYRFGDAVEIGAGAQYIGERTVSTTVTDELPAYLLLDAMVGWHASERWDVRLNLFNLADKFYLERVHNGGSHGVPGAGRTAMLSVNYAF